MKRDSDHHIHPNISNMLLYCFVSCWNSTAKLWKFPEFSCLSPRFKCAETSWCNFGGLLKDCRPKLKECMGLHDRRVGVKTSKRHFWRCKIFKFDTYIIIFMTHLTSKKFDCLLGIDKFQYICIANLRRWRIISLVGWVWDICESVYSALVPWLLRTSQPLKK